MDIVSVIVLAFNVENYITRCLESIYSQTFKQIELVIINDCSTDNTLAVIEEYISNTNSGFMKIKVHSNNENKGSATSRNIGLNLATGDYFTFIDGDDWIAPHGIQNMINEMKKTKADVVLSDFLMDYDGEIKCNVQGGFDLDRVKVIKAMLTGKLHGSTCNKIYNRKLVDAFSIRFLDGADYTEDIAFNISLLTHTDRIGFNPIPYYHYCIRTESMSRSLSKEANTIDRRVLQKIDNCKVISKSLDNSNLRRIIDLELNYFKFGARLPLLDNSNVYKFKLWRDTFPESNKIIWSYDRIGICYKFQLWLLTLQLDRLYLFINKLKSFGRKV